MDAYFIVQGRGLQNGAQREDYNISIGNAVCDTVSLADNQVDCRPPTDRPDRNINDTFCHGDTLSLQVSDAHDS